MQCSLPSDCEWNLCQAPSASASGQVLRPEQVPISDFNALTVISVEEDILQRQETFILCSQPTYILVMMMDDSNSKNLPKRVLLDAKQPLGSLLPLISTCFKASKHGYHEAK